MRKKAMGLLPILLFGIVSCGSVSSSGAFSSQSVSEAPNDEIRYRDFEYPFPDPSEQPIRFEVSLPIRQFGPSEPSTMQYLWGDYVIPYFFKDWLRNSDYVPGNIVTVDVSASGTFVNSIIPLQVQFRDAVIHSVTMTKGAMAEASVIDGKVQYAAAGLQPPCIPTYEKDYHGFDYAAKKDGTTVDLHGLDKVYVAVSTDKPTLALGLLIDDPID